MSGLGSWVQNQWVDRQRRLWREHDAKLAAVWRDDALTVAQPDVGSPADTVPCGESAVAVSDTDVIVLPDQPVARDETRIGS